MLSNKPIFSQTLIAITISAVMITSAQSSSHREAPYIAGQPKVDSTDFYMFNSYEAGREDFVTIIANYIPLQDAFGGPNYYAMDERAKYEIHIDSDGDAKEDLTFRFDFKNILANNRQGIKLDIDGEKVSVPLKNVGPISAENSDNLNFIETYKIDYIPKRQGKSRGAITKASDGNKNFSKPYDYIGNKTFTSAEEYEKYANQFIHTINIPHCDNPGKVFVGQRKDSFTVNLGETFDLVNNVPVEGDSSPGAGDAGGFPGGITQSDLNDDLRNKNTTTIALEIPKSCLVGNGNGVIGGWTSASLRQVSIRNPRGNFYYPEISGGALTQVSRLGNPLVNELVIGLKEKDRFSSSKPRSDKQFSKFVTHPTLPALLNILFKDAVNSTLGLSGDDAISDLAPTNFPRADLVAAFLTGFEGVNQMSTVKAAEMLRLNTSIAAVPASEQSAFGVAGDDLAGFPNGRRPGDDVVDIALRVMMGRLCHPVPVVGEPVDLGLCKPEDAVVGTVAFTDGAPIDASYFTENFPYLLTPVSGSPN